MGDKNRIMIDAVLNSQSHLIFSHRCDLAEGLRKLRIVVAGTGAIGSVIGGCLSRAGADVWLVGPWREHIRALQEEGLRMEDPDGVSTVKVKALHTSEIHRLEKADIVLLGVKSYDTAFMVTLVKPCLNKNAFVVSCQNGMNEEIISSMVGPSATLGCVIHMGATLMGPGHVRKSGRGGGLVIGEYTGGVTKRLETLALLLSVCAETTVTSNLRGERWVKLAQNSIGNPLLALTGYTSRQLHADKASTPVRRAILRELVLVAEALGETLKPMFGVRSELWKMSGSVELPAIEQGFSESARLLADGRSSMSYDLEQGRRMEIEALNGYVVRKGREAGIETPVNMAVVSMIQDLQNGRLKPHPRNLERLLDVIQRSNL
jgi:2-dehydropantoate 2-reductase